MRRRKGRTRGYTSNSKAGLGHLPPAEQAEVRIHLVLEAAAKLMKHKNRGKHGKEDQKLF